MNAIAKIGRLFDRIRLNDKPLPEPEPINAIPRPMTGFFAGLSPEQKKAALNYRGPEHHGSDEFLVNPKTA